MLMSLNKEAFNYIVGYKIPIKIKVICNNDFSVDIYTTRCPALHLNEVFTNTGALPTEHKYFIVTGINHNCSNDYHSEVTIEPVNIVKQSPFGRD